MSYSSKLSNNVSTQNIIITSENYTLTEDYRNVRVNLEGIVSSPTIGKTNIRLQKIFFSSTDIFPTTTDLLFIYLSNDVGMYNKVINEKETVPASQLVAIVPVLNGGEQYFLSQADSSIIQELWDNQSFTSLYVTITDRNGVPVKFDNVKPVLQFIIETDYSERTYDTPLLRVEQRFAR